MSTQAERSYRWLFWCLALIGLTLDQASKYGVFAWLYNDGKGDTRVIIPGPAAASADTRDHPAGAFFLDVKFGPARDTGDGLFSALRTVGGDALPAVNHGALWGLGGGMNSFFAIVSLLAAVAIVGWSCRPRAARERFLCVSLGLILAGTLGNFYDRIIFGGVRDFLHWHWPPEPWGDFPVFNLADCCLVFGAGLLLLQAFYGQPDAEEKPAQPAAAAASVPAAEQVAEVAQ
jgi:lipoprotein signal peptidase